MIIIGVDFHPEFQQIASVDTDSGEFQEKRLAQREEAETFYRALAGQKVRVGMEASVHARWFERLLAELQFELWIGDAAQANYSSGLYPTNGLLKKESIKIYIPVADDGSKSAQDRFGGTKNAPIGRVSDRCVVECLGWRQFQRVGALDRNGRLSAC